MEFTMQPGGGARLHRAWFVLSSFSRRRIKAMCPAKPRTTTRSSRRPTDLQVDRYRCPVAQFLYVYDQSYTLLGEFLNRKYSLMRCNLGGRNLVSASGTLRHVCSVSPGQVAPPVKEDKGVKVGSEILNREKSGKP